MCHDRSRKFLRPEIWCRIWRGDVGFKCVGDGSLVGDDVTFLLCPGGSALTWLHLFVFNLEVINIKRQVICFIADWVDAQLRISTIKVFLHYVKVFSKMRYNYSRIWLPHLSGCQIHGWGPELDRQKLRLGPLDGCGKCETGRRA